MKTAFVLFAGEEVTHNQIPLDFKSPIRGCSLLTATFERVRELAGDSSVFLLTGPSPKNDCYRQEADAHHITSLSLGFPLYADGVTQLAEHVKGADRIALLPGNQPHLQRGVLEELLKTMEAEKADVVVSSINRGLQVVKTSALKKITEIVQARKEDLDRFYKIGAGLCDMPAEFYFAARYDRNLRFSMCSFAESPPLLRFVQTPLCQDDDLLRTAFEELPLNETEANKFVEEIPERFSIPLFLRLEWTTASRLKNRYYPQALRTRPEAAMPPELIALLFKQWRKFYGMGLYLQREQFGLAATQYSYEVGYLGEPTLHPHFKDCLTALNETYPAFHFRSGFFITDATNLMEELSSAIVNGPFRGMMIHLNANNPKTHQTLMGCNCYDTVIENIHHFMEIKRKQQQEYFNLFGLTKLITGIEIVKRQETNHEINTFFDRWEIYRREREKHFPQLSSDEFETQSDYIAAVLANEINFLSNYYNENKNPAIEHVVLQKFSSFAGQVPDQSVVNLAPLQRIPCYTLMNSLTILANGDATLCQQDFNGRFVIGNIKDQSLEDLWNDPKLAELRQAHRGQDWNANPLCSACNDWYVPLW